MSARHFLLQRFPFEMERCSSHIEEQPGSGQPSTQSPEQFLQELGKIITMASNKEKSEKQEREPNYHIYVRLPFNRGNFVDPPPVCSRTVLSLHVLQQATKG